MDSFDAIGWNNKGITYHSEKLYLEATDAYDRAIALDPDNPIFRRNKERLLRDMWKQKSRTSQPREKVGSQDGKKTKSEYAVDWNNQGVSLSRKGFETDALAAFDRAISLDPTHPIFWKNKAKLLSKMGQEENAKTAITLSDAISSQKNTEEAVEWNNKGYTFAEDGNHEEAVAAFNSALDISPGFAEAWNNKGYSLAELGKTDEAISACCRAIELNPAFARSWIENWFSLKDHTRKNEEILTLQDLFEPEEDVISDEPPHSCNHRSGSVEMERVFVRSRDEMGKYIAHGWICPDCGQYHKE